MILSLLAIAIAMVILARYAFKRMENKDQEEKWIIVFSISGIIISAIIAIFIYMIIMEG